MEITKEDMSILITGANRGLGLEFCKQIQDKKNAALIFACCRRPDSALDLINLSRESGGVLKILELDVTKDESIRNCVHSVSRYLGSHDLNLVINNAAVMLTQGTHLGYFNREIFLTQFNANSVSPLMIAQAFHPLLRKAVLRSGSQEMSVQQGAVLNISSTSGSIQSADGEGALGPAPYYGYSYGMSKAALNKATRVLAGDFLQDGILCASFCPGWVKTEMGGEGAEISTEDSVSALLHTFSKLSRADTGKFLNRFGEELEF